ncbi:putative ABC exporter domain-containing protein [Rubripirellula amarantea]|uniref:Uncharacterized protein n=1 Tax=Rubripirellula amarantea TaxID=2527999 RepID=A0A5C5WRF0_9BACT|nr:putative ABC exporter domain-containing protein [Rubripirellula amarantea]MDA8743659.1 putative ABC exporter domain-containing protein [Rubripirellula amarantea]TWT52392.1 hypothetical protein Pla22_00160 [Rubripirellula amarantea]
MNERLLSKFVDPALSGLTRQLLRGGLRSFTKQIKKPTGILVALVMLAMIVGGVVPSVVASLYAGDQMRSAVIDLPTVAPVIFTLIGLLAIATQSGIALLELKPPELQFVLAGPFTANHILSYRLITFFLAWFLMCLFGSVMAMPYLPQWWSGFLSMYLFGIFVISLIVIRTLTNPFLTPFRSVLLQSSIGLCLIVFVGMAIPPFVEGTIGWSAQSFLLAMMDSGFGTWLTLPMQPFANLINPGHAVDFFVSLAICMALIGAALWGCYRVNDGFAELAVAGIAKRQQRIQRLRDGDISRTKWFASKSHRSLPRLPFLAGAGPVAWLQLTGFWRRNGRIASLAVLVSITVATVCLVFFSEQMMLLRERQGSASVPIAMGISCYVAFLTTSLSPSGFSAPVRSLLMFKTFAVRPFPLAVGMLAGGFVPLLVLRLCFFAPATLVSSRWIGQDLVILLLGISADLAFVSSIGLLGAGTNLRPIPDGTPDILQGGRAMLFMMLASLGLLPTVMFAGLCGLIAGFWTDFNVTISLLATAVSAFVCQVLVWWITGTLFDRRELEI